MGLIGRKSMAKLWEKLKQAKTRLKTPGKSSSSSSLSEKPIYIRVKRKEPDSGGEIIDWYTIKLQNYDRERTCHRNDPPMTTNAIKRITSVPWSSFSVALGSTVYNIGGSNWCTDTTTISSNWNLLGDSKKIFTFRPVVGEKGVVVGELLDPSKKTMGRIQPSPLLPKPHGRFSSAADDNNPLKRRITPGSFDSGVVLLAHDTKADSWEVVDSKIPTLPGTITVSQPVLFDNTLYWFWTRKKGGVGLFAYDLDMKMMVKTEIRGLNSINEGLCETPVFIHFRVNEFYLIRLDSGAKGSPQQRSTINCTRIRVSKLVNKQEKKFYLRAFAGSTQTYLLDTTIDLIDSVML